MSCDSTDQRRTHSQMMVHADQLASDTKTCICDCAVVKAVSSAGKDTALSDAPGSEPDKLAGNSLERFSQSTGAR